MIMIWGLWCIWEYCEKSQIWLLNRVFWPFLAYFGGSKTAVISREIPNIFPIKYGQKWPFFEVFWPFLGGSTVSKQYLISLTKTPPPLLKPRGGGSREKRWPETFFSENGHLSDFLEIFLKKIEKNAKKHEFDGGHDEIWQILFSKNPIFGQKLLWDFPKKAHFVTKVRQFLRKDVSLFPNVWCKLYTSFLDISTKLIKPFNISLQYYQILLSWSSLNNFVMSIIQRWSRCTAASCLSHHRCKQRIEKLASRDFLNASGFRS